MNYLKQWCYTVIILLGLTSCSVLVPSSMIGLGVSAAKDKTIGESIDDTAISAKIKKYLLINGSKGQFARINVEVVKGRVMYTGVVSREDDMISAIEIAWAQRGVKEVVNELKVDENSKSFNPKQYAIDSWITTSVKSKIFFAKDIKFVNYTIVTVYNVVYLIGIAQSEDELERVADIAARVKGVERVVSHVKIKTSS